MSVRLRGKFFFLKQINPLRLCPLAIFKDKIKVSLWNLKLKGSPLVIFVQNLFVLILPLLTRETLFFSVIRRGAVAVYQLNSASKNRDISGYVNPPATFVGVYYALGPDNHPQGALSFRGRRNSYVLIPNNGCLDTRFSLTIIMWVYPESYFRKERAYSIFSGKKMKRWLSTFFFFLLLGIRFGKYFTSRY